MMFIILWTTTLTSKNITWGINILYICNGNNVMMACFTYCFFLALKKYCWSRKVGATQYLETQGHMGSTSSWDSSNFTRRSEVSFRINRNFTFKTISGQYFGFLSNMSDAELRESPRLTSHASGVVLGVTHIINGLENPVIVAKI